MWAPLKKLKIGSRVELSNDHLITFRFLLGAFISYDLIAHFTDITLFLTDAGIFPRDAAYASVTSAWWSFYLILGTTFGVGLIYLIHLLLALAFMAGIGLPWVTVILWMFQFSLRNRNIAIMDGSDDLAIVLLFYSIFLPLTKKLQETNTRFKRFIHQPLWHLALIIQMLCLYSFSAMLKSDAAWNSNFTAVALSLRLDILANPLGQWLLQFPTLLKVLTASVYTLELYGPFIYLTALFFQGRSAIRVRQVICILFILFHLGLSATMRLGVFPYFCIAAWIAIFPRVQDSETATEPFLKTQMASLMLSLMTIVTVVWINARAIQRQLPLPEPVRIYSTYLSLHQNWGMFAPFPALDNYHVKTYGEFSDGSRRELIHEGFWYENRHRVKYWLNMDLKRRDFLSPYAMYWCRKPFHFPAPLLKQVRVTMYHKVARKEDASIESHYVHDLWIQPCN